MNLYKCLNGIYKSKYNFYKKGSFDKIYRQYNSLIIKDKAIKKFKLLFELKRLLPLALLIESKKRIQMTMIILGNSEKLRAVFTKNICDKKKFFFDNFVKLDKQRVATKTTVLYTEHENLKLDPINQLNFDDEEEESKPKSKRYNIKVKMDKKQSKEIGELDFFSNYSKNNDKTKRRGDKISQLYDSVLKNIVDQNVTRRTDYYEPPETSFLVEVSKDQTAQGRRKKFITSIFSIDQSKSKGKTPNHNDSIIIEKSTEKSPNKHSDSSFDGIRLKSSVCNKTKSKKLGPKMKITRKEEQGNDIYLRDFRERDIFKEFQ